MAILYILIPMTITAGILFFLNKKDEPINKEVQKNCDHDWERLYKPISSFHYKDYMRMLIPWHWRFTKTYWPADNQFKMLEFPRDSKTLEDKICIKCGYTKLPVVQSIKKQIKNKKHRVNREKLALKMLKKIKN